MFTFKKIDLLNASREDWKNIHSFRRKYSLEEQPDEPIINDFAWEGFIKGDITTNNLQFFYYAIFNENNQIGLFSCECFNSDSPSYQNNKYTMEFSIQVLKEYRMQGIAVKALKLLIFYAKKENKQILYCETTVPSSRKFFDRIGAKIVQVESQNRLIIKEITKETFQNWIIEGKEKNPSTQVIFLDGKIPEKYISSYIKSFNDTASDQPKDELEIGDEIYTTEIIRKEEESYKQAGIKVFTVLAIETSGEISGISRVLMLPGREKNLRQSLTGVPRKFRGRKLGKLIKATMLLTLIEKYPFIEVIGTGNADSNAPMLHINEAMGFKKYKEELKAQISLDQLESYIESKDVLFS